MTGGLFRMAIFMHFFGLYPDVLLPSAPGWPYSSNPTKQKKAHLAWVLWLYAEWYECLGLFVHVHNLILKLFIKDCSVITSYLVKKFQKLCQGPEKWSKVLVITNFLVLVTYAGGWVESGMHRACISGPGDSFVLPSKCETFRRKAPWSGKIT